MQIEIWSDVICPWCYIGKRRFEAALSQFDQREMLHITWRSFELDPSAPRQYLVSLEEILARKYGVSTAQAAAMNARVAGLAKEMNLEYRLGEAKPGNTFDAHRLLHFAAKNDLSNQAMERIMHAYFCESLAIGDRMALASLAPGFDIPEADAMALMESDAFSSEVRADEKRATELNITAVPFFLFDGKFGISGAQPVEVFFEALQQSL